jgi:hypothetical protein
MPVSLTLDEFLERLVARWPLLSIAVQEDVKKVFPLQVKADTSRPNASIDIDLTEPISELVLKTCERLITLVYEERLD